MMKVSGRVKNPKNFSEGCIIEGELDPFYAFDTSEWTRFEAIESSDDGATGYMAVRPLFYRDLVPVSYSAEKAAALKIGQKYTLSTVTEVVPARVVFVDDIE